MHLYTFVIFIGSCTLVVYERTSAWIHSPARSRTDRSGYGPRCDFFFEKMPITIAGKKEAAASGLSKKERKSLKRIYRTELVKRAALLKIVAAWLITVPASGALAALFFFTIRGMMLE